MKSLYYVQYEVIEFNPNNDRSHRIVKILDLTLEEALMIYNRLSDDMETHYVFTDYGVQR